MFLIQRSCFNHVWTHYLTRECGGDISCQGGAARNFGAPLAGVLGQHPKENFWENCLVKYCNFVSISIIHYKAAYMTVEVMLWFFSLEGNPLL
jgi:hypothetical protein